MSERESGERQTDRHRRRQTDRQTDTKKLRSRDKNEENLKVSVGKKDRRERGGF